MKRLLISSCRIGQYCQSIRKVVALSMWSRDGEILPNTRGCWALAKHTRSCSYSFASRIPPASPGDGRSPDRTDPLQATSSDHGAAAGVYRHGRKISIEALLDSLDLHSAKDCATWAWPVRLRDRCLRLVDVGCHTLAHHLTTRHPDTTVEITRPRQRTPNRADEFNIGRPRH